MNDFDVGSRLRELRLRHGLSQRQLAEAADVPHGQISMIETNKSSPSVASLRKILGGLDIGMSEFIEPEAAQTSDFFYTPQQLRDLTSRIYSAQNGKAGKITLKQVGNARAHKLQILHETYEPGADTAEDMLGHVASEGGIVVSGEIELTVGDRVAILKAGDAYLFDSQEPHRFRNIGDRTATVISACTPPYLQRFVWKAGSEDEAEACNGATAGSGMNCPQYEPPTTRKIARYEVVHRARRGTRRTGGSSLKRSPW